MNSRERVLAAFHHEEPDCVPIFVQSIMPVFYAQMEAAWADEEDLDVVYLGKDFTLYKRMGIDMSWGGQSAGASPTINRLTEHPLPTLNEKDMTIDMNGRLHKNTTMNGHPYSWYVGPYLSTEEQVDEWYEKYWLDVEYKQVDSTYIDQLNDFIKKTVGDGRFVPTCGLGGVFEGVFEGMTPQLFSRLLLKKPDKLKKIYEAYGKHAIESSKVAAQLDYDVYNLADDQAYKGSTYISPKMHNEIIIPIYKQIVAEVHEVNPEKMVFFHSDGFTEPLFPGLIEAGFNGVESLEPGAGMDLKHLKETYGDKLCLIGNIDCSRLLPFGTTEDIENAVKKCISDAGQEGGYILSPCTDFTDSCKFENGLAMVEAVKKWGNYPLEI
ncbi:MAG TPA: uroporphyrinogen decarboxylase family protein [Candidatus Lokiarchaeia archaeon]|nr:uroporphyrinogen decarboxylase family protein [Candidatus Lokiarchaeia archaeon]